MTLSGAFTFKAGNGVTSTDADTVLEFFGLTPTATWDPEDAEQKCKFYEALISYLDNNKVGVKSESEGGYSITYDREQKVSFMYTLALESGCQSLIDKYNPQPIVQNKSHLW